MFRGKQSITLQHEIGITQNAVGETEPAWSEEETVIAAVYPMSNTQEAKEYGRLPSEIRRVLVNLKADARLGDKAVIDGNVYRVRNLMRHRTHQELTAVLEV